jgi:tRNA nucleotidyltransferase (CCA-adding enzyme)
MATITEQERKKIDAIGRAILKDIKPSETEIDATNAICNRIMARLKSAVPKNVEVILAGSVARGTQLSGSSDIDIFLLFPKAFTEEEIGKKGLEIGKSIVDKKRGETFIIKYAEHPYVKLIMKKEGIKADIVPAFKISDSFEMGSSVDRTQIHNEFINANLTEKQKDEVRILKSFLREHNAYGAEAKTEGFSGYLCELLIHYYGSFSNLISEISELWLPFCIDPKSKKQISDKEIFKRFNSDFIVIDPVDPNRNVAAAVSKESLARFVLSARKFAKKPSLDNFYGKKFNDLNSKGKLKKLSKDIGADFYVLSFPVPDISEDIIWQQLKKLTKKYAETLRVEGFTPFLTLNAKAEKNILMGFFIGKYEINSVLRNGPSIFIKSASDAFIGKHKLFYLNEDRIISIEKSKNRNPEELLRNITKAMEFPSNIKKSGVKFYINSISEKDAKLLYEAYENSTFT